MAQAHVPLMECHHCGSIFQRQTLERGETACCSRCNTVLWRYSSLSVHHWLALVLTALVVFAVANAFPVAHLTVQGISQDATLLQAIAITWSQAHEVVAVMTALAGFVFPLLQLLLLVWVLTPLSRGLRPPGFAAAMRILGVIRPWCMVPVYLLAVLVSVVKLASMAQIGAGIGLVAYGVLTVLLTMFARLPPHAIWRYAEAKGAVDLFVPEPADNERLAGCHVCGQVQAIPIDESPETLHHCIRCSAQVHLRKPHPVTRTWALLIAAVAFYFPANLLPVMQIRGLTGASDHTILGGVIDLWHSGSWDIALIVFIASVVVPVFKLLALIVLLLGVQRQNPYKLRARTRLYEGVELIGQWSMLDVFVVILLSALADFRGLMQISAGTGAAAFGVVVIFTMLAAMSFDPRRSWDQALNDDDDETASPQSPAGAPDRSIISA